MSDREARLPRGIGETIDRLTVQRDEARATVERVRQALDAWDTEGLGSVPGLELTNWPDAWDDIRRALDGAP